MRTLLIFFVTLPLQGCLIFIPGSVISGVSDSITGAEGTNCVGASAKVGDTVRLPGNGRATVKSLSGTSIRCTNPELPIRALLAYSDEASVAPKSGQVVATPASPKPSPVVSKASFTFPDGWTNTPLTEQMIATGGVVYGINRTSDIGLLLSTTKRDGIGDLTEFAKARRAGQASRLTDAQQLPIKEVTVNGKRAVRFNVTGAGKSGLNLTYVVTVIEGATEIVMLSAWTSTGNFENQNGAMTLLADRVSGIE